MCLGTVLGGKFQRGGPTWGSQSDLNVHGCRGGAFVVFNWLRSRVGPPLGKFRLLQRVERAWRLQQQLTLQTSVATCAWWLARPQLGHDSMRSLSSSYASSTVSALWCRDKNYWSRCRDTRHSRKLIIHVAIMEAVACGRCPYSPFLDIQLYSTSSPFPLPLWKCFHSSKLRPRLT